MIVLHGTAVKYCGKKFYNIGTRGQCYKNTTANYSRNFNLTFSRVKMTFKKDFGLKNITAILG
jgi:hypothetical protein